MYHSWHVEQRTLKPTGFNLSQDLCPGPLLVLLIACVVAAPVAARHLHELVLVPPVDIGSRELELLCGQQLQELVPHAQAWCEPAVSIVVVGCLPTCVLVTLLLR